MVHDLTDIYHKNIIFLAFLFGISEKHRTFATENASRVVQLYLPTEPDKMATVEK